MTDKTDTLIYHYCSEEAFLSIVSSGEFWLTGVRQSNDAYEMEWPIRQVGELATEIHGENIASEIVGYLDSPGIDIFAFCLSESADLLSQWRGYGDDGRGVAIGFHRDTLSLLSESDGQFDVCGMIYDRSRQKEICSEFIDQWISRGSTAQAVWASMNPTTAESEELQPAKNEFYKSTRDLFLLKNWNFSEEREHRIRYFLPVSDTHNENKHLYCYHYPLKYRTTNRGISPYISKSYRKKGLNRPIRKVVLGPKNKTPDYIINSVLLNSGNIAVAIAKSNLGYQ